jgi:hypothetical protein
MIFIPDTLLQRAASIMLLLYVGAFLGQALCVLPTSHMESRIEVGVDINMEVGGNASAAHAASQHGEHSGPPEQSHSGACAVVACASAVTTTPDHSFARMSRVSTPVVAYADGTMPPEAEMVLPPPRLS